MIRVALKAGLLASACSALLLADVTYQEAIHTKGGALVDMMKKMADMPMMGRMGGGGMKQAFQDQTYQIYVKGNKMARVGATMSTIYDLDAGTITQINHERQTYRTETFEDMRKRAEEMQQRMSRSKGGALEFDVKSSKTGQSKIIDGEKATEILIVLTAKQANEQGQMVITTHTWTVPLTPLRKEAQEFHRKLAEKWAGSLGGLSPMMGAAGSGMAAAMKEVARVEEGYPVESETVVSGMSSMGGPMAALGGGNMDPNTPMLDTVTSSTGFVKGVADDSKLAVPAGYQEEKGRGGPR